MGGEKTSPIVLGERRCAFATSDVPEGIAIMRDASTGASGREAARLAAEQSIMEMERITNMSILASEAPTLTDQVDRLKSAF